MEVPESEFVVDWPALFVAADWVEAHCVVPDGFRKGDPFELYDWQLFCTLAHYRVRPDAQPVGTRKPDGSLVAPAAAFTHRRSSITAPQKTGKGPWAATGICLEAVGPAVFAGFAAGGEAFDCFDWGCSCGWGYEYEPGEPMGRPWATPLIQLLATAEAQTDNVFSPLQAMIRKGPLAERMRVGETFIRCPNDGKIEVVTSSASARLGNPVTYFVADEPQLYTVKNGLIKAASTMRRGVAGMGGRSVEIGNAIDPTIDSQARRTKRSKARDIFRFHRLAPAGLDYSKKRDRRKIHAHVYAGSNHVDLDVIEADAFEEYENDPASAERQYGNREVAGSGVAFNADRWVELAAGWEPVSAKELIVIGVDGARFRDALGVVATDVVTGRQWPLTIVERPEGAGDDYEHDLEAVDAVMLAAFDEWEVWRAYVDPQFIEGLVDRWQGRWGDKRVVPWFTYRTRPMAFALRAYQAAMKAGEVIPDGDPVMAQHIGAAVRKACNVVDDEGKPMWLIEKPADGRKIDGAMAGCISWEARGDAIAANATKTEAWVPYRIR